MNQVGEFQERIAQARIFTGRKKIITSCSSVLDFWREHRATRPEMGIVSGPSLIPRGAPFTPKYLTHPAPVSHKCALAIFHLRTRASQWLIREPFYLQSLHSYSRHAWAARRPATRLTSRRLAQPPIPWWRNTASPITNLDSQLGSNLDPTRTTADKLLS